MDSLVSGTLAGTGSFRCEQCGFVVTLAAADALPACPSCGGDDYARASLFGAGRFPRPGTAQPTAEERSAWLARARAQVTEPGDHLVYEEGGRILTATLSREWTRIGRSLAADLRLDDPTVSRRHALVVRREGETRVLDDRSLNGVFVNGQRTDSHALADGDEILVGRYRIVLLHVAGVAAGADPVPAEA